MLNTIILERVNKEGIEIFRSFSEVSEYYDKSILEIYRKIPKFEVAIIKSTIKIDKDFLDRSTNLKVIARAGTGLDNIDLQEVKKRNIKVFSVKKGNTVAAAEYIITLIFVLLKKIFCVEKMIKQNNFSRHEIVFEQLSSMKVGIVGMGNLGIELSMRLKNFRCKLYSYDPFSKNKGKFSKIGGKIIKNLDTLLSKSDIIIMAANLNPSSEYLINKTNISNFKIGSYFINCARAKLVDQEALLYALDQKIISYAAIDLIDPEPLYNNSKQKLHPLVDHSNVFYSPHVAALTEDAQRKIAIELGKKVKNYLKKLKSF